MPRLKIEGVPKYRNLSEKEQAKKFQKLHEGSHKSLQKLNSIKRSIILADVEAKNSSHLLEFYKEIQELELHLRYQQSLVRNEN